MLNVSIKEFKDKWYIAYKGEDTYTNGKLSGKIAYEDNEYVVIKLEK